MRLISILALALVAVGCPDWQRPRCETPGTHLCASDQPHYCSPSRELTPLGDEPCAAQGRTCALDSEGIAYCARPAGGAP